MMRWWWFGPAVTKLELARELGKMKEGGIGGVEVQPVYPVELDDPARGFRNFPYLSDEFIDDLRFAAGEARRLGLRMDVTLGSGWPFGGSHIPITQAGGALRILIIPVPVGTHSVAVPSIRAGEELIAGFLAPGEPKNFSASEAQQVFEIRDGRLRIPVESAVPHVVMFFISSRTGMMVKRPAIGAEGFVLDHFDRGAIENHLHAVGNRLIEAFGDAPPYSVFSDSLEVYGSDWTGDLLQQFGRRRGYDLTPYLPVLVQDIGPKTADIRHDWGRTLTELINERYLTPVREWAAQHKTLFRSQTYGIPAVTLSSNALVDLPEGEGAQWRSFSPARWASSANHLLGRNVTSAETWTWLHSPAFRATPLDMKVEADLFFLQGVNQLIGHGWPYSPKEAGEPGWAFYAAAALNDHNPWWPVMGEVTRYLQRVSFVLRQGKPVNDVAVLLPTDDAWAQFTPGKASVSESMPRLLGPDVIPQILDAGFNFDFIDAETIAKSGIPYPALILPGVERLPLATYRQIEAYAHNGGTVIATRNPPSRAPGLQEAQTDTSLEREISQELFHTSAGKGLFVPDEKQLGKTLTHSFRPDFTTSPHAPEIGFVHRKLPFADLYFLANTSNHPISTNATFRASESYPESWDASSGNASQIRANSTIELNLQPYESRVIVFAPGNSLAVAQSKTTRSVSGSARQILNLGTGWKVSFPGLGRTVHMDRLHSWTDEEETRFYSGDAVYEKNFDVSPKILNPSVHVYLDFGPGTVVERPPKGHPRMRAWLESPVREAAQVFVNDQPAGSIWKPPYELEISGALRPGNNDLKIIVENLATNTLAGHSLRDYRLLNSRYGERFVPQDMENLQPLPSGLVGPLRLVIQDAP
ncbi:MAG: glycoside hydrolase [Acidobacteria bacterium]|nr:MAG: glycoside hydrolase [Acidobacteriota bacterium]PYT38266.1 MAG: glycoside hydrolase [Acidobacteriota bacterium]PYT40234.1 MAG: glycoside hydrolase [Acidobacteriota bacterium]